jgi:ElaB/YqjD/DUF883 family membrane-anchored ribosome-binding protein
MPRAREADHDVASRVKEVAKEKLQQAEDKATELYEQGVKKTRAVLNDFEGVIRNHPVPAVLVAAGVGLLFGRFRVRPVESLLFAAGTGLLCGALLTSSSKGKRRTAS